MQRVTLKRRLGLVCLWPSTCNMEVFQVCCQCCVLYTFKEINSHFFPKISRAYLTTKWLGTQIRSCSCFLLRTRQCSKLHCSISWRDCPLLGFHSSRKLLCGNQCWSSGKFEKKKHPGSFNTQKFVSTRDKSVMLWVKQCLWAVL